jgi:hypothetical protein
MLPGDCRLSTELSKSRRVEVKNISWVDEERAPPLYARRAASRVINFFRVCRCRKPSPANLIEETICRIVHIQNGLGKGKGAKLVEGPRRHFPFRSPEIVFRIYSSLPHFLLSISQRISVGWYTVGYNYEFAMTAATSHHEESSNSCHDSVQNYYSVLRCLYEILKPPTNSW